MYSGATISSSAIVLYFLLSYAHPHMLHMLPNLHTPSHPSHHHIPPHFTQRIDFEREQMEGKDPTFKGRLISEKELPAWLLKDEDEVSVTL